MVKRKTGRHRPKGTTEATAVATTTVAGADPDATSGLRVSLEHPLKELLASTDATTAPEIEKEAEPSEAYAGSQWDLVYKILLSSRLVSLVLSLVLMGFIGWILIQDNKAGNLSGWSDLLWSLQKCGIILAVLVLICSVVVPLVQRLYQKMLR